MVFACIRWFFGVGLQHLQGFVRVFHVLRSKPILYPYCTHSLPILTRSFWGKPEVFVHTLTFPNPYFTRLAPIVYPSSPILFLRVFHHPHGSIFKCTFGFYLCFFVDSNGDYFEEIVNSRYNIPLEGTWGISNLKFNAAWCNKMQPCRGSIPWLPI